ASTALAKQDYLEGKVFARLNGASASADCKQLAEALLKLRAIIGRVKVGELVGGWRNGEMIHHHHRDAALEKLQMKTCRGPIDAGPDGSAIPIDQHNKLGRNLRIQTVRRTVGTHKNFLPVALDLKDSRGKRT